MIQASRVLYVIEVRTAKEGTWRLYGVEAYTNKVLAESKASDAKKFNRSHEMAWDFRIRRYEPK